MLTVFDFDSANGGIIAEWGNSFDIYPWLAEKINELNASVVYFKGKSYEYHLCSPGDDPIEDEGYGLVHNALVLDREVLPTILRVLETGDGFEPHVAGNYYDKEMTFGAELRFDVVRVDGRYFKFQTSHEVNEEAGVCYNFEFTLGDEVPRQVVEQTWDTVSYAVPELRFRPRAYERPFGIHAATLRKLK